MQNYKLEIELEDEIDLLIKKYGYENVEAVTRCMSKLGEYSIKQFLNINKYNNLHVLLGVGSIYLANRLAIVHEINRID